tara:strand:+ start:472 stop:1107 length:636 start_codon:yes stop_codon:yes gene_type:complete
MASDFTIENCLFEFCSNWGRGQDHMNKIWKSWSREFETTPDRVLEDAIRTLIRTRTDGFIPCLGVVIDQVKALMGGSHTDRSYRKCGECTEQGGRYVAVHYEEAPERFMYQRGRPFVHVFAAPCSCDFGKRISGPNLEDVIRKLNERIASDETVRCYYVSSAGGDLTKEEKTLHEEYQQWLHHRPEPTDNPYRKMLSALLQERRGSMRGSI